MPDASFAETAAVRNAPGLSTGTRIALILVGYIPLFHAGATVAVLVAPMHVSLRVGAAALILFVLPPLVTRMVSVPEGTYRPGHPAFLRWWLTSQLQMLFNRLPLEEALRLVPGLYSAWLRLWGSAVGSLVFWSPRAILLDRGLLRIGSDVVVGAGARLAGHILTREADGELQLVVAPITIEDRAVVGGWALIGPGTRITEGEFFPTATALPPFRVWSGGRRLPRDHAF